MKRLCLSIFLTLFLGLNLSSLHVLAQSCTQLSLPENALASLCIPRNKYPADLDFSPDGKTLASLIYCCPREIILWDVENKIEKLTIVVPNDSYHSIRFSPDGKTFVCGNTLYDTITGQPKLILSDSEGYREPCSLFSRWEDFSGSRRKRNPFLEFNCRSNGRYILPIIYILPTDTCYRHTQR